MALTETLVRECTRAILGKTTIPYQGKTFDVGPPFPRVTLESTLRKGLEGLSDKTMRDPKTLRALCTRHGIENHTEHGVGKLQLDLFEKVVEPTLDGPVFVTHYPAEVSPLARKNDADPFLTDRFELFIGGREFANGFSELNDPEDQAERFHAQIAAKERGDEEAMFFDADYIRALEHAMPPAAGMGLGIDRLAMLLTDSASIRDVLLFPQLKREE
jgi:lysyl-tRNA synthetase class 2